MRPVAWIADDRKRASWRRRRALTRHLLSVENFGLYDVQRQRDYCSAGERDQFFAAPERAPCETRTFCLVLAYSGYRISEALALTADRVDIAEGMIVFATLQKRRSGRYMAVRVPPRRAGARLRATQRRSDARRERLWTWSRGTAWRRVRSVMRAAGLDGPQTTPKRLRHGFGVQAVSQDVPLSGSAASGA